MFDKILGFLGSGPAEQITGYFKQKAALKQQLKLAKLTGKISFQKAKYEAKAKQQANVHTWEMASLANSGYK
ncbi:hypothetical protein LCGC14_2490640, partial [marine sediment metagenome]